MARRFRRAHIGAHGYVHADVAGQARKCGTDEVADRHLPAEDEERDDENHHADNRDGGVLAVEIGPRALLNRGRDLLHSGGARALPQDRRNGQPPIHQGQNAAGQHQ